MSLHGLRALVQRYRSRRPPDTELRARLHEIAARRRRWGYRQFTRVLRREGRRINRKEGVAPLSGGRLERPPSEAETPRRGAAHTDPADGRMSAGAWTSCATRWAMGACSGRSRWSTTARANLGHRGRLLADRARVARVLDRVAGRRGYPARSSVTTAPSSRAPTSIEWAHQHGVLLDFIDPGKPVQNAFIESFNGRSGTNASTSIGSPAWPMRSGPSKRGESTTKPNDRTAGSRISPRASLRRRWRRHQVHSPRPPDHHNPRYRVGGHV